MISWLILNLCNLSQAQNLVPNPSFEEYTECPYNNGQIWKAEPWVSLIGGCDYFHECGINGFGIPESRAGGGYARTGQAYTQIGSWFSINGPFREVMMIELDGVLEHNVSYRVEFYLSLMDSMNFATRNIGAHFSATPHPPDIQSILTLEPQVRYEGSEFLTDKEGWMRISGSFVAQGGERHMAIGNFDDDANTDTLSVPGGGAFNPDLPDFWDAARYFIDDVSVVPDSVTGINEPFGSAKGTLEVWPNPAGKVLWFSVRDSRGRSSLGMTGIRIRVLDAVGRKLEEQTLKRVQGDGSIDISALPTGIYFLELTDEEGRKAVRKFVKE